MVRGCGPSGSAANAERATPPGGSPGALPAWCSEWRLVVEVAAPFRFPLSAWERAPLPRWLERSTLAVAHFREAPTSSASSSVPDRFSPSGVSQLRCHVISGDEARAQPEHVALGSPDLSMSGTRRRR